MSSLLARGLALTLVLVLIIFAVGCPDAEKAADAVFKKKGLSRLRTINDSIKVGSVILVKDGRAIYADNIIDYYDGTAPLTITTTESKSVISDFGTNTNMNASVAVDFLNSFLPVDVSGKIQLTSNAKLDQIAATVQRIKVPALQQYLADPKSKSFKDQMAQFVGQGYKVFISYEAYQSNKIKLVSSTGSDISANANILEIKPLVEGIKPSFSWVKNSKLSLDVNGDTNYTFALRTLKLKYKNNAWSIEPGNFQESGVLAAGDKKFSYSPITDSQNDFPILDLDFEKPTPKPTATP